MSLTLVQACPLCSHPSAFFYEDTRGKYFRCKECCGVFLDRAFLLSRNEEQARYEEHNNDIDDVGYQKFVSPITNSIMRDFTPDHDGLDFGAGTGPVITKVLTDHQYCIKLYDPFFHNEPALLGKQYDYIACCEVIEHFHYPSKEFALLRGCLRPGGKLYCMTDLFHDALDFKNWYYRNDPTHVFIYCERTCEWIKETFNFSSVTVDGRLVTFAR